MTCKLRHVRCDEQTPRCSQCQKSSRQCEYSADPARPGPSQLKIVLWQPDDLANERPSLYPGQTNDESRALNFFRTNVAAGLGGLFDASFWSRHVLLMAQHEPSVRHAVVALASLSEMVPNKALDPGSAPIYPETFAIRQQTKAISELRAKMEDGSNPSPAVVLTTCALFTGIEMIQNHHDSALRHMSSGTFVFLDWYMKRRGQDQSPCDLTNQLRQVFGRLMLQLILFVDTRPGESQFLSPSLTPTLPSIPVAFKSVDEARDCLNSCLCSIYHSEVSAHLPNVDVPEVRRSPLLPAQSIGAPIRQWKLAFASFLSNEEARLSAKEIRAAAILELHQVAGSVAASAGPYTHEIVFDSFEDEFRQILALASRVLHDTDEPAEHAQPLCPSFDMGVIPPLYYAASRCRHPDIRRQALDLLRKGPAQEGIWHNGMLSGIAGRIIEIEEAECSNPRNSADIPAEARLSLLNATVHSAQRTVTMHCCRQQFKESGKTPVLHELIRY